MKRDVSVFLAGIDVDGGRTRATAVDKMCTETLLFVVCVNGPTKLKARKKLLHLNLNGERKETEIGRNPL